MTRDNAEFYCSRNIRHDNLRPHLAVLSRNGMVRCPVHGNYMVPVCSNESEHDVPVMAGKRDATGRWLCADCIVHNRGRPLQATDVQNAKRREEMVEAGHRLLRLRDQLRP